VAGELIRMKIIRYFALVSSLAAASLLSAQTTSPADGPRGPRPGGPGGHGPHGRGPGGHPVIRTLDLDHNGELSTAEIAAAATSLQSLDTDRDGTISANELRPPLPPRPADAPTPPADAPQRPRPGDGPPARPFSPVMLALDANGDGALSSQEIANAPASLAALDLNKDGKLTPDELRPLPPAR